MSSPSLLLALAPAATVVASRTMSAAQSAGESFANVLSNLVNSGTENKIDASGTAGASKPKTTLAESLQKLGNDLRDWLRENGANGAYSVEFHLAADGASQVEVSGDESESVKQLLATDESWITKLRQLAASMQAESAQRNPRSDLSPVTIQIDPNETRLN